MLVLNRRVGQGIQIGDEIEVRILRLINGSIRVGIKAPDYIKILRDELLKRDQKTIHLLRQSTFAQHGE